MRLSHYRAGNGEPLVLIHGIGSRWQVWEPVLELLEPSREVIALDMPGFGASPMPPAAMPAGSDSLVTLVAGFLQEMGVDRPHVAGNSLGGLVALELARRGLARSATGLSPAGFANRSENVISRSYLALAVRGARRVGPRAEALTARPRSRAVAIGKLVAHPTRMPPADAAASLRALAGAPWFDATLRTIKAREFQGGGAIEVPVTIAWGEKDRVLPPRQAKRAARAIPSARMVTLTDCGHVPTYDDPEQVAHVLLEGSAGAGAC